MRMIRNRGVSAAVIAGLFAILIIGSGINYASAQGDVQEITVSAKKFDFTPADIHVKVGAHVRLTITATDRDHGIEISPFANGADAKGDPGLKFDSSVKKRYSSCQKSRPFKWNLWPRSRERTRSSVPISVAWATAT
jgi:hypothetical protein